jgi:hypothetical protein
MKNLPKLALALIFLAAVAANMSYYANGTIEPLRYVSFIAAILASFGYLHNAITGVIEWVRE